MTSLLTTILPIFNVLLPVGLLVGFIFAVRQGYFKTAGDIQERVTSLLNTEIDALNVQVKTNKQEVVRLRRIISTIQVALKRRGLIIEINGDSITLIDEGVKRTHTFSISTTNGGTQNEKENE